MSIELESFLKKLAAELHITPKATQQIWKDYHPEQETFRDEPQKPGTLSGAAKGKRWIATGQAILHLSAATALCPLAIFFVCDPGSLCLASLF